MLSHNEKFKLLQHNFYMTISTYIQSGTKILMADKTLKPIESIKIGDFILSLDSLEEVKNIHQSEYNNLLIITGSDRFRIGVTPEQSISIPSGKCKAKDLQIDDVILCFNIKNSLFPQYITDITEVVNIERKVYNLSLTENHIFCANDFIVRDFISQQK